MRRRPIRGETFLSTIDVLIGDEKQVNLDSWEQRASAELVTTLPDLEIAATVFSRIFLNSFYKNYMIYFVDKVKLILSPPPNDLSAQVAVHFSSPVCVISNRNEICRVSVISRN